MPFLAPFIALGVLAGGYAAFGIETFATLLYTLGTTLFISGVLSVGQKVLSEFAPKPNFGGLSQSIFSAQQVQVVPNAPRRILYGQNKTSGVLTFMQRSGDWVHMVLTIAGHQITAVDEIWFDDAQVYASGTVSLHAGFVGFEIDLGDPANAAQPFPGLAADLPMWGSSMLQRGCAKVKVKIKLDSHEFPNGLPSTIQFVTRGKPVFDPRNSVTAYSTNAALCARDFATSNFPGMHRPYGLRIAAGDFDDSYTIAAANTCDEAVTLAAGGTQPRYTCNGTCTADEEPKSVMRALLSAMAGDLVPVGGKWRLFAGAWRAATATVTEDDFRDDIQFTPTVTRTQLFNAVKGTYVSPQTNYQPTDYPAVTNATYEAQDGERIYLDAQLRFTNDPVMAMRISKIGLEKNRRQGSGTLALKFKQLDICAPDTIGLNFSAFSWSGKTFEVRSSQFSCNMNGKNAPVYGVDLQVQETDANIYAWSTADETGAIVGNANNAGNASVVAPVTGLTLLADASTATYAADGVGHPRILASWTAPADVLVTAGGAILLAYRRTGDANWTNLAPVDGATTSAAIAIAQAGISYDVQVIAQNVKAARSAAATASVTATNLAPLTGGAIALPNANFEAASILPPPGWVPVNATLSYETGAPHSGTRSLKIVATGPGGAQSAMAWKVSPGEIYRVAGWARADGGVSASIRFDFRDGSGTSLGGAALGETTAASWTQVSGSAVAPAGAVQAAVMCLVGNAGGGTVYFDDILIVRQLPAIDLPYNVGSNTTNRAIFDSIDNGTNATARVYGAVGGPGTAWDDVIGSNTKTFPFLTSAQPYNQANTYGYYDPLGVLGAAGTFYVTTTPYLTLPDGVVFCGGPITTFNPATGTGTSSGGGPDGGAGGHVR
jgi:hypothetical protein